MKPQESGDFDAENPEAGVFSGDVPDKYKVMYKRAMSGKSRKAAIRLRCLDCVDYSPKEVENCTAKDCPLYAYRLRG